ncbi:MAG: glycosyltransferase family 39 protein [Patescibacteria group bacterium]
MEEGESKKGRVGMRDHTKAAKIILAILPTLFILGSFFYIIFGVIRYPFPLDYGEGLTQYYVRLLQSHGNYFFDIQRSPFAFAAYPPVYFLLTSSFSGLFNVPTLLAGRLLSVIVTLLAVLVLFGIFHSISKNKQKSAFFAALFLVPFFVSHWAALARVDMLALFFALAGFYVFERYSATGSSLRWFAPILFSLSFYTKQSFIAAPIAIILYLLFTDRKECLRFFSLCAGLFGGIFLTMNIFTGGQFFLHLFFYTIAPLDFKALPFGFLLYFLQTFLLLIPAALILKSNVRQVNSPYFIYCVAGILSVITWAKVGANVNYFIEPFAATLLFSGALILKNEQKVRSFFRAKEMSLILIVFQIFFIILGYSLPGVINVSDVAVSSEHGIIDSFVKKTESPILVEDVGFAEVRNQDAILPDPNQMEILIKRGVWSENLLIPYCANRTLNLVVAGWRLGSFPGFMSCLERNYKMVFRTENHRFYKPKKLL